MAAMSGSGPILRVVVAGFCDLLRPGSLKIRPAALRRLNQPSSAGLRGDTRVLLMIGIDRLEHVLGDDLAAPDGGQHVLDILLAQAVPAPA